MDYNALGAILFLLICLILLMKPMSKDQRIKTSFVPVEGAISNYFDCTIEASDDSTWKSVDNRWVKA